MATRAISTFVLTMFFLVAAVAAEKPRWAPAEAPLMTRWAKDVSPENAWPEYPRPQMTRDAWTNLNGLWDYAITDIDADRPEQWDGEILVPFAIESALSGVGKKVGPRQALWYRRAFETPKPESGRVLLHFGAVDWLAEVWVNGVRLGDHRGGYDAFSFDITDALVGEGPQEIVVRVWDPTDAGAQPRGKQVLKPGGIFYTAVTGIWQTVWLEPVPAARVASFEIVPDVETGTARVTVHTVGPVEEIFVAATPTPRLETPRPKAKALALQIGKPGETLELKIDHPKLWSPDTPYLYGLMITVNPASESPDIVHSYFGLREIALGKDESGVNRLLLNGEPLFQFGPLDQGWWPDGLYTAPTDEALRYDIEITKQMGFNMARKHVKVEPARWYYWADKLGLLVWQDLPSLMARGEKQRVGRGKPEDAKLTAQEELQYHTELRAMIDGLRNHPSIVVWVPFNEGWGQHKTNEVLAWTKAYDPTRLVDGPSGWEDRGQGDMKDMHKYPGPDMFSVMEDRASVLGEFGGLGLPIEGHLWQNNKNWGYRTYKTRDELARHYHELLLELKPLIDQGLAAAIYTQTTDVEIEVNGLLTYDRAIIKIDPARLRAWHEALYAPSAEKETAGK